MEQSFLKNSLIVNGILSSLPAIVQKDKLQELLEFYSDRNKSLCLLEGAVGSFKTDLFNVSKQFLNSNVLIFSFKCFEGSTLDDFFLSFFEDLKKYTQEKKITLAKIETNSLSERIIKYLTHITLPSVIMIDSLENILSKKNLDEKEEIIRFLEHINSMNKFKVILISSYFEEERHWDNSASIKMMPYTKEHMKEFFPSLSDENLDKFYEITRGNQNYVYITSNILTTLKTTLEALILEFSLKKVSYEDFILQKLVTFVPEKVKNSLFYLSLVNEPINGQFLIQEGFFSADQLAYVIEKGLASNEYGGVFLKNCLRKYLHSFIPHYEKIKIHTFWRDFYTSQLPLKPKDRVILISRNTMRGQIEYHSVFVTEQRKDKDTADMSLMSYLNSNLTAWNIKNTNIDDVNSDKKQRPQPPKSLTDKEKGLEKYELTKEELSLLSVPVDMRKKEEQEAKQNLYRTFEQKEDAVKQEKKQKSIEYLYKNAEALEAEHDYETAFVLYYQALELNTDKDYAQYEPLILEKLAYCAKKMNKTVEAIEFYNRLTELYSSREEIDKVNEVRIKIAGIYKETYKINHARVIFENFINKKSPASDSILIRSYIELAGIEEDSANSEKAVEYYKKAFALLNTNQDTAVNPDDTYLAQAYFKYALILDDFNQTQAALDFYQRSIRTAKEGNIYLSAAYTNIGEIIKETGNNKKASDYFKMALKTDIAQSNYEGVYYICLKLARLYETTESQTALDWLLKSLSAAKRTKETLYITNAYLELGDYYFEAKELEKALKAFLNAQKNLNKQEHAPENDESIMLRIRDLKSMMPRNIIDKVTQEVEKNGR